MAGEIEKWIETFSVVSEIKFANGRISKKPDADKSINTTLLGSLYENSQ